MLWFGLGAGFSGPALPAFVGLCLGWYAFINQGCPCSWPLLYRFLLKDDNLCCPSVSAEIWGISFVNWAERGGTCVLFSDKYRGNWVFFLNRWLRWVQPWGPLGSGLRGQALTCSFPFCSQACTDHWLHKTSFNLCCTKYRWSLIEQTTYLHNSVMMTHRSVNLFIVVTMKPLWLISSRFSPSSVTTWVYAERAGCCPTARSRSESLRRGRREEVTQSLFKDNLYGETSFHGPKRQTAPSIPAWQTDRSIHTQSEPRLIALLIPTCRGGFWGGGFVSQQRSLTCQMWKSPLARTQSEKQNPTGQMLPIDTHEEGV